MIVYHGSTTEIRFPDNRHSQKYLDFGEGFYVTSYREQAERWARRKAMRKGGRAVVNVYELAENYDGLSVLTFNGNNERWLDFVCACRKGEDVYKSFDIVIGSVANDDGRSEN